MITPVLAAYSLCEPTRCRWHDTHDGPIMTLYLSLLRWCVFIRWKTASFGGTLFFVLSVGAMAVIPKAFVPPDDFSQLGSRHRSCRRAARCRTPRESPRRRPPSSRSRPKSRTSWNSSAAMTARCATGKLFISLVPRAERSLSQKEWEQHMMPIAQSGAGRPLEFLRKRRRPRYSVVSDRRRSGHGWSVPGHQAVLEQKCMAWARCATRASKAIMPRPEIVIHPRLDIAAAQLGVSVQSISQTIRIATLGDLPQNGAKFSLSRPPDSDSRKFDRKLRAVT